MVAKLQRLASETPPAALTRKADRQTVSGKVIIQSNSGDRAPGRLRDISAYGCNLACEAEWLRIGRFISLRLAKDWTIQAIVRWNRDGATGVEFLRPLGHTDVELLGSLS